MSRKYSAKLRRLVIAWALTACAPDDPVRPTTVTRAPESPRAAIVDGTNGGAGTFRWLPPIVAAADYAGTIDAAAAPTVEVCIVSGAGCTVFATSGVNLPAVSAVPAKKGDGAHFTLSWNTKSYSLDPATAYRIVVRLGALSQGSADVDVVPTQADLASVAPASVGVVVNGTLEINFLIVHGIERTWLGGAIDKGNSPSPTSMTEWANAANWSPAGVPFQLDTVVVPNATYQPVLTANVAVSRIAVLDGAIFDLGAYDATVATGASTTGTGAITATAGRLNLTGFGTIAGLLPRLIVSGSYSLAGDVRTTANLRIAGGRLRTTDFRLRLIQ